MWPWTLPPHCAAGAASWCRSLQKEREVAITLYGAVQSLVSMPFSVCFILTRIYHVFVVNTEVTHTVTVQL